MGLAKAVPPDETREACGICRDILKAPYRTLCDQVFFHECIAHALTAAQSCPTCRAPVAKADIVRAPDTVATPRTPWTPASQSLGVLVSELHRMRQADPTAKALIFSQFMQTIEVQISPLLPYRPLPIVTCPLFAAFACL